MWSNVAASMHALFDLLDSCGRRTAAGAVLAPPTVNPGDEDEDDEEEGGGGGGGGSIDPEEEEGYEEDDEDDEDPLWAVGCAAAHHGEAPSLCPRQLSLPVAEASYCAARLP
jgi:hypothetical protein